MIGVEEIVPDELQEPGSLESTGTHFEITDSEYLNIIVDSSENITLFIEPIPEIATLHLEPSSGAP